MAIKTASGSDLRNSLSSGLVLLNTTSFSGVASQSINDVFSATYTNYKIIGFCTGNGGGLTLRYRVSGSDDSSANYQVQIMTGAGTGSAADERLTNRTQMDIGRHETDGNSSFEILVNNPFATARTTIISQCFYPNTSASIDFNGGSFTQTTSFTGFTVIGESGNLTGTIQVFGVNQ